MPRKQVTIWDVAVVICRNFPKVPDGCAALCMDRLGCIPEEGCRHAEVVHRKTAKAILELFKG